jgi:hypothetical protein
VPVAGPDGSCFATSQAPEQIIVYRDASYTDTVTDTLIDTLVDTFFDTVTDTITTYKPVALFIMQDRSGSMVTGFPPPADPNNWNNSTAAITAFVNDPRTQGIDIGLGTFPYGPNNTADCNGSDCGTPVVPIAPLPGNARAMIQAMQAQTPSNPIALTPIECGLRGMINQCLTFTANSPTGEQCVAILVTDGTPTQCSGDQALLQQIIADGRSKGVLTFALGLPGADLNQLNAFANAGGTGQAIDVSGGSQKFIDALNNIRQKVSVTTSHTATSTVTSTVPFTTSQTVSTTVTTPSVISTPLSCQWGIPAAPTGQTFDPAKVNLQLTPAGGQPTQFGHLESSQDCTRAGGGWYYDDPRQPTKVLVCPQTCDVLKASTGGRVDILFGCATIPVIFH